MSTFNFNNINPWQLIQLSFYRRVGGGGSKRFRMSLNRYIYRHLERNSKQ